jgi:hypothetical protein
MAARDLRRDAGWIKRTGIEPSTNELPTDGANLRGWSRDRDAAGTERGDSSYRKRAAHARPSRYRVDQHAPLIFRRRFVA